MWEPQVGFPEEEGEELQVVPGVGRGTTVEHTYGCGVGGEHLLLGKEGVLPPPHGCSDMFVGLADLGVQPFNLFVGTYGQVGAEVFPSGTEAAPVGLVGAVNVAIQALVLVTLALQRGQDGTTTRVGATDTGDGHLEEEGIVPSHF